MEMLLEQRQSQDCKVCDQEVLPERQVPLNIILIWDYSICPSCRQTVSVDKKYDPKYRRKWRRFKKGLKLDK